MALVIAGLGTAVPERVLDQEAVLDVLEGAAGRAPDRRRKLAALFRRSGVQRRHCVVDASFYGRRTDEGTPGPTTAERMRRYVEEAPSLAQRAAENALADAGWSAGELTHLVTVSCTGFSAPGFDLELFRSLELHAGVQRTHVGYMGCHGGLNGLRVARALVEADPRARVLLVALELCSLHLQVGWEQEHAVPHGLFGDGAAAIVARAGEPDGQAWAHTASASRLFPATEDAMAWTIGDHGFEMRLSVKVPTLVREGLGPWLEPWLRGEGLGAGEVRSWAVHPGGPRVLEAVAQALPDASPDLADSRAVLARYGNMSSPTTFFVIQRQRERREALPAVALGFGPGLAAEAALFR